MTTIDTYGDLELPEKTSKIEVLANPVQIITSLHSLFKKLVQNITKKIENFDDYRSTMRVDTLDLYDEAIKLFDDKKSIKPNENELEEILKRMRVDAENWDESGIFLSGMHNSIDLDVLVIDKFFNLAYPGYKLEEKKILFLNKADSHNPCYESEGAIVINTRSENIGLNAKKGIIINNVWQPRREYNAAESLIFIDRTQSTFIGKDNFDSQIVIYKNRNRNQITSTIGHAIFYKEHTPDLVKNVDYENYEKLLSFEKELQQKLKDIDFLKTLHKLPYKDQVTQLRSFDFKQLEKDIYRINDELERMMKK